MPRIFYAIIVLLIGVSSCQMNQSNFRKQKFTNLKKIKSEQQVETETIADSNRPDEYSVDQSLIEDEVVSIENGSLIGFEEESSLTDGKGSPDVSNNENDFSEQDRIYSPEHLDLEVPAEVLDENDETEGQNSKELKRTQSLFWGIIGTGGAAIILAAVFYYLAIFLSSLAGTALPFLLLIIPAVLWITAFVLSLLSIMKIKKVEAEYRDDDRRKLMAHQILSWSIFGAFLISLTVAMAIGLIVLLIFLLP